MLRTVLKLVAFFTVCMLLTAWLFVTIGNVKLFSHTYELSATFDDVTGLLRDDNVKVAGVPVGKVTGIKIVKGRAKVTFSVRDDVKIPTDSKAAVRWRNLLGQRYLYLYPGDASTVLRSGEAVPKTVSVVDLGELFNRLGPIIKAIEPSKVNQFLDTITAALDGNETKVRQALADLGKLTQSLASRDEAIGRLIENSNTVAGAIDARDAQIRTILDNLLAVSTTFNEHVDVLERAATDLSGFSENFGTLLSNNRSQLDSIVHNLKTLTDLVQSKLPQLDDALSHLDDGAAGLFQSAKYGEWLNQTVLCGRIGYNPSVEVNNCIKGDESLPVGGGGTDANPGGAPGVVVPPSTGVDALTQLFGGVIAK